MKNYYTILGCEYTENIKEIEEKFSQIPAAEVTEEQLEAVKILTDPEAKAQYDNELVASYLAGEKVEPEVVTDEEVEEFLEAEPTEEKGKKWYKTALGYFCITAAGVAILGSGVYAISKIAGCGRKYPNTTKQTTTEQPTTEEPTTSIQEPTTEVPTTSIEETTTELETTIDQMLDLSVLNASTVDAITANIVKENRAKGLDVDFEIAKSALLLVNRDEISKEEMAEMFKDGFDNDKEIENTLNYLSEVGTHNTKTNVMTNYIYLADLCYDESDKEILKELAYHQIWLKTYIKSDNLNEKQYQSSIKYINGFFDGSGKITVGDKEYGYSELSSGAALLAEEMWKSMAVEYMQHKFVTETNKIDFETLSEFVIDGHRFMPYIANYELSLEKENTIETAPDKVLCK